MANCQQADILLGSRAIQSGRPLPDANPEVPLPADPPEYDPSIPDRRRERVAIPPCPKCAAGAARPTLRTDYVIYLRCSQCAHVWSVPKPGEG